MIKIILTLVSGVLAAAFAALLHHVVLAAIIAGVTMAVALAMLALSPTVAIVGVRRFRRR